MTYFDDVFRCFSQLVNCVFFGGASQESISSRCYRENITWAVKLINGVFFWQNHHCRGAYAKYLAWAKNFVTNAV